MLMDCLLERHRRMKQRIDDILDLQLIEQQIENESFDIRSYADFVQGVMSQICAPVRDEDVARIKEISDIIPLFKYVDS